MANRGDDRKQLRCSFCNKTQEQVRKLIAGPNVYICDECIEICAEIIEEELMEAGHNYIHCNLDEICIFLRKNKKLPLAKEAASIEDLDWKDLTYIEY